MALFEQHHTCPGGSNEENRSVIGNTKVEVEGVARKEDCEFLCCLHNREPVITTAAPRETSTPPPQPSRSVSPEDLKKALSKKDSEMKERLAEERKKLEAQLAQAQEAMERQRKEMEAKMAQMFQMFQAQQQAQQAQQQTQQAQQQPPENLTQFEKECVHIPIPVKENGAAVEQDGSKENKDRPTGAKDDSTS